MTQTPNGMVSVSGNFRKQARSGRPERQNKDDGLALRVVQAARQKSVPRNAYRIEHSLQRNERIFTVVAPSGAQLYSFTDRMSAEAEAAMLNATDLAKSRKLRPSYTAHGERHARVHAPHLRCDVDFVTSGFVGSRVGSLG